MIAMDSLLHSKKSAGRMVGARVDKVNRVVARAAASLPTFSMGVLMYNYLFFN